MSMEKSKAGIKIRCTDDQSLPNQNTIIINIIYVPLNYGKLHWNSIKKNGIEQSKNEKISSTLPALFP